MKLCIVAATQPFGNLDGLWRALAGHPWLIVAIVALLVLGWILHDQLARIVESFHKRDMHRREIQLMQSQLLQKLAERDDIGVKETEEEDTKVLEIGSVPTGSQDGEEYSQ